MQLHALVYVKETIQRASSAVVGVQQSMLGAARALHESNNVMQASILQIDEAIAKASPTSSVVQLFPSTLG